MSEKKNWGQSVLGWFVVKEDQEKTDLDPSPLEQAHGSGVSSPESPPAPPIASDRVHEAPPPVKPVGELPATVGGAVEFDNVFEAFGVDASERELWGRASALVNSLPPGTDPGIKKQIVEASLKAFGISIDKIIESGVEQIQALDGYQRGKAADVDNIKAEAGKRIAEFEEEISRIRSVMLEAQSEQTMIEATCNGKKLEVQSVLEFFGREAVEKVVRDSPKLVDPSAPPNTSPPKK